MALRPLVAGGGGDCAAAASGNAMTRFLDGAMNDPMQMQHMGKVPGGAFGAFGPFSGSLIHLCNLSEKIRKQKQLVLKLSVSKWKNNFGLERY